MKILTKSIGSGTIEDRYRPIIYDALRGYKWSAYTKGVADGLYVVDVDDAIKKDVVSMASIRSTPDTEILDDDSDESVVPEKIVSLVTSKGYVVAVGEKQGVLIRRIVSDIEPKAFERVGNAR